MNDLRRIYQQVKDRNPNMNDGQARQQAWIIRDRLLFEATSVNFSPAAAAAAGAGGGGGLRRNVTTIEDFPSVTAQSYIITWADTTDNLWKFVVYNFGTGQLSATYTTDLVGTEWTLNNDESTIQSKGFTLEFQINGDSTRRIYFVNADGTVVGEKSLDDSEDFQYTERAAGYLGTLNGVSTFYHFDGDNVRTHTFDTDINLIEIDDASYDDVTADGSMMVEAPNNVNYYIARPNGDLVDVSQYFNANSIDFRMDYNTTFIYKAFTASHINVVSQEGTLANSFDVIPFNMETVDESWFYGENCAGSEYGNLAGDERLYVSYDGDSNQFVSLTFSIDNTQRVIRSRRDWQRTVSSFGKNLVITNYNESESDSIGYIANNFEMWWLPKGATAFNYIDLSSIGTFSLVLGDGEGDGVISGFTGNRSFTFGQNPIFMYAIPDSEIIVGFLEESGFSTQSTGILSASCSNIWGHNIGEHSFAVFDVGSDGIWQIYDSNSKVAETQTTSGWSWGDGDYRQSLRNGTLAVIDSDDTSNSFIYTTEIGLTAGPTGLGRIYNIDDYGVNTGLSHEYQVITQYMPGEEMNQYVEGFYVLSKSGLSSYVEFFGVSASSTYTINNYTIGSEMISFELQDSDTGNYRYQVYNLSTLDLIHDWDPETNTTEYFSYDNRFYVQYVGVSTVEIRLVSLFGLEILNLQTTDFNREANDAVDND